MIPDDVVKAVVIVAVGLGALVGAATAVLYLLTLWQKWKKGFIESNSPAAGLTGEEGTSRRFPKMDSDPFEKLKNVVANHGITLNEHQKLLEDYGEEITSHEATFRVLEEQEKGRTALLDERLRRLISDVDEIKNTAHAGMQQSTGANRSLQNGILSDIKEIKEALVALTKKVSS